jgi:hypothetical protein
MQLSLNEMNLWILKLGELPWLAILCMLVHSNVLGSTGRTMDTSHLQHSQTLSYVLFPLPASDLDSLTEITIVALYSIL